MKVILLEDLKGLGKRGDVKEVADGYAVNVLIPKKKATQATRGEIAKLEQSKILKEQDKKRNENVFLNLIKFLEKIPLVIEGKKSDAGGHLFAQIKNKDIVGEIFKLTNIKIDEKQIIISTPIKTKGRYEIHIKQGNVEEKINVEVK